MTVVRRVHLYTGLMLVPWVMLYGVTAFLFNHPTVGSDRERRVLDDAELESTPFQGEVDADELARLVADALGRALAEDAVEEDDAETDAEVAAVEAAASSDDGEPVGGGVGPNAALTPIELDPRNARMTGTARLEVRGSGQRQSFSYDTSKGRVLYSRRGFQESTKSPFDRSKFRPDGVDELVPADEWKEGARVLAAAIGPVDVDEAEVSMRSGPVVEFDVEYEGELHEVRYDVGRATVTARPADESSSMGWRSFLLRLHLAHTYPMSPGLRTLWAVLVDAMALSMVAWAVSGLLMWWQIKKTRGVGTWMVAVSVLGAAVIGAGMYGLFVA